MSVVIPSSHIYQTKSASPALSQGDTIFINDDLKKVFLEHFNFEFDPEFLMVMSQSCDLVRKKGKKPKISHIILSLIRPFKNYINRTVKNLHHKDMGSDIRLIKDDDYGALRSKVSDLINNANSKAHLFLPKRKPFKEHMITVFNTIYPLRFQEQYDILLKNRALSLSNEYKAKIGDILSTLFDRVVVTELTDLNNWDKQRKKRLKIN